MSRLTSSVVLRSAAAALLALGGPAQAIVGGTSTTAFGHVGTGVQVTDNWVLTARHVALGVGGTYSNGYGSSLVDLVVHYSPGSVFPEHDLSLMRLGTGILAAPDLAIIGDVLPAGLLAAPLPATIATDGNQVPRGYAHTTVRGVADQLDPDGAGARGLVPVNYLITYQLPDRAAAPYVQGGDSGGALFFGTVTDSTSPLWGITSAFISGTDAGGAFNMSGFVQLASYRHWIDTTLATYAPVGPAPQTIQWISAVPEPQAWVLMAAGAALLTLLRRGGHRGGQVLPFAPDGLARLRKDRQSPSES